MKIFAIGGFSEIGNNSIIFENNDEAIMIDCGLMFSGDAMYGIDFVVPDPEMFARWHSKLKAVIITHAHEDHIGGVPFTLSNLNVPIYATPFATKLIKRKFDEQKTSKKFVTFTPGDEISISNFKIKTIPVTHSVPETVSIAIDTNEGWFVVTSDFKTDEKTKFPFSFDKKAFKLLQKKGVHTVISDSTNVERQGLAISESTTIPNIKKIIKNSEGYSVIALFPSNVERISNILQIAKTLDKKVFLAGKSMEDIVSSAKECGYLQKNSDVIFPLEQINNHKRKDVILLCTGTQGEWRSALYRISLNEFKDIRLKDTDSVLLCSRQIPGNEKSISRMIDNLYKLGVNVFYGDEYKIHATGHGREDDLVSMIKLLKPKYFIPGHGEYRQLVKHRKLAIKAGIKEKNTIVITNGDLVEFDKKNGIKKIETVEPSRIFIESEGHQDISLFVLRERRKISDNGLVCAVLLRESSSNRILPGVEIFSKGFIEEEKSEALFNGAKKYLTKLIPDFLDGKIDINGVKTIEGKETFASKIARGEDIEDNKDKPNQDIREFIRIELRRYFKKKLGKRPIVLSVMIDL